MPGATRELDILDERIRTVNLRNVRRADLALSVLVMALAAVGLLALYSASRSTAADYWQKQAIFFLCLLYTSPSPRDRTRSRMPSSA